MDRPVDRDQVWIATKKRSGETELYALTAPISSKARRWLGVGTVIFSTCWPLWR